jgi:hypothetical protein
MGDALGLLRTGSTRRTPSLTKLSEGNTVYTTDFRSLYATMLGGVLGTDPKPFLQGSFPQLALV